MTIALGVLTRHSIILAADSEEGTGYAGDLKQATSKITFSYSINVDTRDQNNNLVEKSICITGAGDSAYLSVIKQDLMDLLDKCDRVQEFAHELKKTVRMFYRLHVMPFAQMTDLDLRISLIVGVRIKGESGMWLTNLNTTRRIREFTSVAVGSGAQWAKSVLTADGIPLNDQELTVMAVYAIRFAKEHASGCGKDTVVISMPRHSPSIPILARFQAIQDLEAIFREYEAFSAQLRHFVEGIPAPELFGGIDQGISRFQRRIDAVKTSIYPPLVVPDWANLLDSRQPEGDES